MKGFSGGGLAGMVLALTAGCVWAAVDLELTGDWQLKAVYHGAGETAGAEVVATLTVQPPEVSVARDERFESIPIYNPAAPGWAKGERPLGVRAEECTTRQALDAASFRIASGKEPDATVFERGRDYELDDAWGTFGRLSEGLIGTNQPIFLSYRFTRLRIDSVVLTEAGTVVLREGAPHVCTPVPPTIRPGERRLANLWLPGHVEKLGPEHLFPILEDAYPEAPVAGTSGVAELLPRTREALKTSRSLKILAWGDSVTDGGYLPADERWQAQFVSRLEKRFPRARIELITQGWGGRNTESFLTAPPGHVHNYQEQVLGARPDLIISEFVNDAGLNPAQVEERYGKLLADFQGIGTEWIILTPHYVAKDWMGLQSEREIDDDPRAYVKGLREFSARHSVALADAAKRYGRLWRQGLPYSSLLTNTLNHPNARGMAIFADSLMALFP